MFVEGDRGSRCPLTLIGTECLMRTIRRAGVLRHGEEQCGLKTIGTVGLQGHRQGQCVR